MTVALKEVALGAVSVARLRDAAGGLAWKRLTDGQARAGELLAGRGVWSINSTATGGGVAEILRTMLPYTRAAGVDARWLIVRGNAEFFRVTKRIHNFLHEHRGDGGELGADERAVYERVSDDAGWGLRDLIRAGDVVVLHDPQTLGLAFGLKRLGASVIWRCHIGTDQPGELSDVGWDFLSPYLHEPDVTVFSRDSSVPARLPAESVKIIAPSIDPCSVKNAQMQLQLAARILEHVGLVEAQRGPSEAPAFRRGDGAQQPMRHQCDVLRSGPAPRLGRDQLVVHICRWDRIKDPVGVMRGFAEHTLPHVQQAQLILAGPSVHAVTDDPEAPEALDEAQAAWRALPHELRRRVTIACVPMHDIEENAAIVNALQRHADVIVKKSLEEGFGLGVTEALWKRRAVVASDVGGHRDQIQHGHSGLLVDPTDLRSFGNAIVELLADPSHARALGDARHHVVKQHYLHSRQLADWDELLATVVETNARRSATTQPTPKPPDPQHAGPAAESPGHDEANMHPPDSMPKPSLDERTLDRADHDPLTGLLNRRRFENDLDQHLTRTREGGDREALLSIDVDRYREMIQQHGPAAAQGLIRSIADVLAKRLTPNDTLARMGGDEFAAILPHTTPRLVQRLADDLCAGVREHMHTVNSSQVHATISIGAILLDPRTDTHQSALAAADTALHEAKTAGSDRAVVHEPSHNS